MKEYDFIIIGAGLAGLTAHHDLQKKGYSVLTLEKDSFPGGRVRTEKLGEGFSDTGAQFFTFNYPRIVKLCQELNLQMDPSSSLMGQKEKDKDYLLETKNALAPYTTGLISFGSWLKLFKHILSLKIALRNVHPENPLVLVPFDNSDARSYCLEHLNSEIYEKIFVPYFSAFNYADPSELSSSLAVRALLHMASGKGLMGIAGGLARLPHALSENKEILYETRVLKVEKGSVTTHSGTFRGKHIIVATTATVAGKMCGDLFPSELKTKYSPSIHESFLINRASQNASYGTLVSAERNPDINVLTDEGMKASGLCPGGFTLLGALYSREGARKDHTTDATELLGINKEDIIETRKTSWDEAIPVLSPGHFRKIENYRKSLSKNSPLLFAGDYLSTGCAEGAVESGYFVSGLFASRL